MKKEVKEVKNSTSVPLPEESNTKAVGESHDPELCPECGGEMTESEEEIDFELCEQIVSESIDELIGKQDDYEGYDFVAAMFSMFVHSIHILNEAGWSKDELVEEINNHLGTDEDEEEEDI